MSLFSKRAYRAIKTILVSPQAEILTLIIRIISILILLYLDTLNDLSNNIQYQIISQDQQILSLDMLNKKLISHQFYKDKYQNASLHVLKDNFWDLFVDPNEFEILLSGFRLVQYQISYSVDCQYDISKIETDTSEQQKFINSLSSNCNPANSDALSILQPQLFICNNTKLCLYSTECIEFQLRDIFKNTNEGILKRYSENLIKTRQFGTYPNSAFIADIKFNDREEMEQQINKLILNDWITNNTIALVVQFNRINKFNNVIYSNTFIQQFHETQEQTFEYQINQINTNSMNSSTWYSFSIILIVFNFFFIMKIIFEGSIDPRATQLLVFLVSILESAFSVICTLESAVLNSDIQEALNDQNCIQNKSISNWNNGFPLLSTCHNYILLDATYQIQQIRIIFLAFVLLFIPFNVFWIFSYLNGTELIVKFINLIYRTTIHFFKMFIIRVAQYVTWSLAFYIAFRKNFESYDSYASSLYCMIIWSIPTEEKEWERGAMNTGQITNALLVVLFMLCRIYVFLMILSFTSISIQSASDFEFDIRSPSAIQNLENIHQNIKKLDKFQKNYLSDHEQNKLENGKLVAWLNLNIKDLIQYQQIIQECIQKQVKLQQFQNISDLSQFVSFLFQIKPQLLFKSQVYFRIILDLEPMDQTQHNQPLYLRKEERQNEYINLVRFFQRLKDKGSRVPLLINYSQKNRPADNIIITFFKIYPYIHLNSGNYDLFKEFILSKDVRQWQKRVYIRDEENQDFDEEESDANQIN
ncbi:unnamed protein product [Paramecium pentaurelia]|uniref:Transmembrane protein n=1 Tax=Paramecium pentaurelia TaxID=43138 RepID=A0A8S1T034_9CILI|nr:unnamed protein product [Paramecium pentaurelia]